MKFLSYKEIPYRNVGGIKTFSRSYFSSLQVDKGV